MIVDASAILAVVLSEPDRNTFVSVMKEARGDMVLSPVQYFEVWARVDRMDDPKRSAVLDAFFRTFPMVMVPIDRVQAALARDARRIYGRGTSHPARLNMGDCFAYALAKALNKPLLYKGDDFSQTDVRSAL